MSSQEDSEYTLGHVVGHEIDETGKTLLLAGSHSIYKGFQRSKKPKMNCPRRCYGSLIGVDQKYQLDLRVGGQCVMC